MMVPSDPLTMQELQNIIKEYLNKECIKVSDAPYVHRCGNPVKIYSASGFNVDASGNIEIESDGFGFGEVKIPYCEKCEGQVMGYHDRIFIIKKLGSLTLAKVTK